MRLTRVIFLLCIGGSIPSFADDGKSLTLQLPAGKKTTVTQTIELTGEAYNKKGKGLGGKKSGHSQLRFTTSWTDESKADDGGRATEVERTYASSRFTVWGSALAPTELEGVVLSLARSGDVCSAKPTKGTPDTSWLRSVRRAPMDPVEMILPKEAVKADSSWEIPAEAMEKFFDAIGSEVVCAAGPERETVTSAFMLSTSGKKAWVADATALKARVSKLSVAEAVIDFGGRREFNVTVEGSKATIKGYVEVKGTLRFNPQTGQPSRLDVSANQLTASLDGEFGCKVADADVMAFRDNWTISRVYAAAK